MPYTDPTFEQQRARMFKGTSKVSTGSTGGITSSVSSGGFIDQTFEQQRKRIYSTPAPKQVSTTTISKPTPAPKVNFLQQTQQNVSKIGQGLMSGVSDFAQDVEKKVLGLFSVKGGEQKPITLPKQKAPTPTLTPDQQKKVATLKVGEKIPGYDTKTAAKKKDFGNIIDNVFNRPAEFLLNNTGLFGEGIKKLASDIYNNPIETLTPNKGILNQIKKYKPELYQKFEDSPLYKFEEAGFQGIVQGALRVYANWNPKVETFLDTELVKTGKLTDLEIGANTVGNVIGTIGGFVMGGELVSALKFGKAALPATFAALGQTSLPASTPVEARLRNLVVDTVAGTLLEYIKPLANLRKMGMFEKGFEYSKQLTKSMAILSGQTYLDARSVGASDEQAKEMVKDSLLILLGLHGFMIAGKAGEYATRSKFKEGSAVFTPDQARGAVVGSNLEGTKVGNAIMKASMEAEAQGKNISIDMAAAKKSGLAGMLNLKTPNGIAITKIEFVDAVSEPKFGTQQPVTGPEVPQVKTEVKMVDPKEIQRVADNLQKNNTGMTRATAEAMAKDVIRNRKPDEIVKPEVAPEKPPVESTIKVRVPETFNNPTEEKAFTKISKDPQGVIDEYTQAFENEVSPDLALTLFEGYEGANAGELSRASGTVKSIVYDDLLKTQQGMKNNTVYISAGGSGSGKTSAVQGAEGERLKDGYAIVLDTTFSNNSAPKDIQKALDKGYQVHVAYTFRDPAQAWEDGALKRVGEEGRVVSEGYFLKSHIEAQKNIIEAYNKYKDNENVDFSFFHNKPDRKYSEVQFDNIAQHLYNDQQLAKEIIKATDKAYESGRITEKQYKALKADRSLLEKKGSSELSGKYEEKVPGKSEGPSNGQKLTIAPSLADTPEKVVEEAQKLGLPPHIIKKTFRVGSGGQDITGYARPAIGRTEFKTIVQNSDEFKANPVLTVDKNMNLVFDGERIHFSITPEALQIATDKLNPGDEITVDIDKLTGKMQQMRIRDEKGGVLGYNPKTETAPEGEIRIPDIGAKAETNQVFIERLGKDPNVLARHRGGTVRDVYDLGDYVATVANSPRGLEQNDSEGDWGVDGMIPELVEKGLDYVIVKKATKDLGAAMKFLKPLQSFSVTDFDDKTSDLQNTMETMGLSDFLNYDLLWNDFIAPRNWGFINGEPVLTDAGALNRRITATSTPDEYAVRDWREILQKRKEAVKTIRVTGKYPKEVYAAYNKGVGGDYTAAQIDRMPLGEVRQWASDRLPGGTQEFDRLIAPKESGNSGQLGFNPKNLTDPFSEVATEELKKIVKQSEIAKVLSEKLNVPIRRGKFRFGSAIGIYKPGQKVVRIKSGGINTIFHEVAHYLDDTIGFSDMINATERKNLMQEYGHTYEGKPNLQRKEAFAEYMRFRMTGQTEKIAQWAPEYDKLFNEKIKSVPEVNEVINTATEDYKRWNEQPATSKILSQLSIGAQEKGSLRSRVTSTLHDLYTSGLDDLHPLSEFSKLANKKIGKIDATKDPYILARNLRGWVGKADLFLNSGTFRKDFWKVDDKGKIKMDFTGKSYTEIMKPVEKMRALDDFRVYLVAQRIVYDLAPRKIVSGIKLADAEKALEELNKKFPEFERIAQERRAYKDALLEYAKDNGVLGEEGLKKIKELNHYHVPFYRVMEESGAKFLGKSKVGGNIGNPIKKIKGSEREIIDPLESDVKDTYAIINAAERNNIGVAMANVASQDFELGRLFEEVAKPMKPVTVNLKEVMDAAMKGSEGEGIEIPDELAQAVVTLFRPTYATGPNMLNVNMGDKQKVFEVDSDLFNAIQGLNIEDMGIIMKILSFPAKLLRAGATLSPDFSVRNPLRDQFTAFAYSKHGFIPGVDLIRGMFELFKKGDTYNLWKASGGEHAMMVSLDRQDLQKSLDDVLSDSNLKDTVVNIVKNPLRVLQILSEIGEMGTRLGEMRNALARGVNPVESAHASRNITLDFSQIGAKTRGFNAITAFFNANLLGTDAMIRNFKNRPFQTLWKVLLGITLPSILLYFANRDDPRWKEIPQWQKNLFWIVMTKDHIWRIPKPFELGVLFGSVPERILEVLDTKDPQMFNDLKATIVGGFTPGLMPTGLIPIIENITNYSFFMDRPIVNRGQENLPPPQQSGPYTTEVSKILGQALNTSPAKIDNLVAGYSGGLGKYAQNGLDAILLKTGIVVAPSKPAKTLEEMPVIKAFMVREPIGTGSESVNRVYNQYAETNAQMTYVKQLVKQNKTSEAIAYVKKHPNTLDAVILTPVVDSFSTMNKAIDLIRQSEKLTPDEKTAKIREIQTLQTEIAQRTLAQIDSRGKK